MTNRNRAASHPAGVTDAFTPAEPSAATLGKRAGRQCISRPMAERRVLTDDARMVWIAELPDATPHSETVSQGYELVGVEQTVVCGLDADSRNEPIRFAACLARRLGWRLSLVPLPEAATEDERLGRLFAASTRDQAGFVVTEAVRSGAGAAALVERSRGAACPLIAVPRGAPVLGTGPILCGIASRGPSGATAPAASRLANAVGARLRLVHVVSHPQPSESAANGPRGVVWHALNTLDLAVPVDLVIDEGEPAKRLGELGRREDAALLAVGAPSGDAASPDGVVAAVLRDSQLPVMVVPGGTALTRASEAA
jgi:nucleotide-binding universal stress UspA family protein